MALVVEYELDHKSVQDVGFPSNADIISVCGKNGNIVVNTICDKDGFDTDTYRFYLSTVGDEVDTDEVTQDMFLGTIASGESFTHVFCKQIEPVDLDMDVLEA